MYGDEKRELAKKLCLEEKLSAEEAANQIGINRKTIQRWLKDIEYGHSPQKALRNVKDVSRNKLELLPQMERLYVEDRLSSTTVAKQLGIGPTTVLRWLREKGCYIRTPSERHRLSRTITSSGYIRVYRPEHHKAAPKGGYVLEHILVWEEAHNKRLPDGWVVHHINGIKTDNRPSNLFAMPRTKHSPWLLLQKAQEELRKAQIENRQLQQSLENNQSIFYISEN
jgi:hypothetical protein